MGKIIPDAIIDDMLDVLALSDRLFICSAQPADYADAATGVDLATHILTAGVGGGDFTADDGDTSGRKLILAAQNGFNVDHNGDATHYALGTSGTTTLRLVGTLTLQTLTAGNTINFPATDVDEIRDLA